MAKKHLSKAGLQLFVNELYDRGFQGMGLSKENFTTELKEKLEALGTPETINNFNDRLDALEALIAADSNGSINKFNEIVAFLAGLNDSTDSLEGLLAGIAEQIADAKKAGTDAALAVAELEGKVYSKTEADDTFIKKTDIEDISEAEIKSIIAGE